MGGGGGAFNSTQIGSIRQKIRAAREEGSSVEFESKVNQLLLDFLKFFNNRDHTLVSERLDKLLSLLSNELEGIIKPMFGGSVAKHTYVDGLSDIDALICIPNTNENLNPNQILTSLKTKIEPLKSALGDIVDVKQGKLAITITYADNMEIQLLPAIQKEKNLKVPSWSGDSWSEINPKAFSEALTKRNKECNNQLVPTIKLCKAIMANSLPDNYQVSGYHTESMAVSAFRNYDGAKTLNGMISHFFSVAPSLVMNPIKDKTNQSVHADEYLGNANSPLRQKISHLLHNLETRIINATDSKNIGLWHGLLSED